MQRLKLQGFTDWAMQHWTFANDHGQNPQMQLAQRYVAHWPEMREKNVGLLLWGGVGTGKSFMAGCIANALMEQEVAVCMTNFARIMNELNNAFSGRNEVVDRLCGYPLLVIDDFGMERGTEYTLEQIYNIIDSRYRSRKPLIVTTNLTLTELKNPQDTAHARIYDRLLELCTPIACTGPSMRKDIGQAKLNLLKTLLVYNRIAYDETNRKIGQNPRESWRMVPDNHPAIISWELFDEVSALREAEQAVREERKTWCKQRRKNNPNIFKGRIFCKECGEKLVCHWQRDGSLYFYCKFCHVSISEKDLWNGINKELHQRMEEHRDLQKLVRKSSGKSKLQSKEIATKREIEQASGNIVRLESQKRSGYEQYVLGKISKEKFLKLKQDAENEIEAFRQTKAENEKELVVVQEELQQKKQIAGNTEVLLTADNLQQYVKKIEVDHKKNTYTEFAF